jgi:cell division septum initiation protein DivIVA
MNQRETHGLCQQPPKITGWSDYEQIKAERDQLKAEVERLKASWNSAVKLANENADSVVIANRQIDEWHGMARELAHCINEGNNHGYGLRIGDEAIARFNAMEKQP